ncbi:MAG: VOC family protein [bacterium]|nr:VOC family protein [bacterium]
MGLMGVSQDRPEPDSLSGRISALSSVAIEIRNPDIARHFYTETLGMQLVSNGEGPHAPLLVQPCEGGPSLMLFRLLDASSELAAASASRLHWTGLSLTTDNVDAVYRRLQDRNVQVLQSPQTKPWGVRDCVFADPDGNVFNLVQSVPV